MYSYYYEQYFQNKRLDLQACVLLAFTGRAAAFLPNRTLAVAGTLGDELLEEQFELAPVLLVDAVLRACALNLSFDESGILQLRKMLGAGGLRNGQLLVHLSEEAFVLCREELHNGNPRRVAKCPGVTRQPLLLVCIIVVGHNNKA